MDAFLLIYLKMVGLIGQRINRDYFYFAILVDEDIFGMYVSDNPVGSMSMHICSQPGQHEEDIPHLFVRVMSADFRSLIYFIIQGFRIFFAFE